MRGRRWPRKPHILPCGAWARYPRGPKRSMPTPGRPERTGHPAHAPCNRVLREILFELTPHRVLDRTLEHADHESEPGMHAHAVLADFDPPLDAAALDQQGIALPLRLDRV